MAEENEEAHGGHDKEPTTNMDDDISVVPVGGDTSSTSISALGGEEDDDEVASSTNTTTDPSSSMPSIMGTRTCFSNDSVSGSTSDLLGFSRRRSSSSSALWLSSSELSDKEARQQTLKPAAFLQSNRKSRRLLPISRLRFSKLGLVGRDGEMELLKNSLKRAAAPRDKEQQTNQSSSREVVWISGHAGTGKTALATALAKSVERVHGLYVKGKFDLYLGENEPYAGMAAACREICARVMILMNKDNESFASIRKELLDKLGSEKNLCRLIQMIPDLAEIVGDDHRDICADEEAKRQPSAETKARFHYAFRIFIRIIARHFAPLVILLDDLQWSDAATLDLLQVLVADRDNQSLMVIGIYRSNEVDQAHPLSRLIGEMKQTSERDGFRVAEIEIGNLNASQVNEIIMGLLSVDEPDKTLGLTKVCLKRTHGNVFSLLVFLNMLQTEGLLLYNLGTFQWSWDEDKILSETAATANVVDLMKQKIERLPPSVGQRLSIAACLGFSFEPAILHTVWTAIISSEQQQPQQPQRAITTTGDGAGSSNGENDNVGSFLVLAEQEGFLEAEPGSSSAYRWVHDKVQEAAMSLVPSDELPSLKARVGKILVNQLTDKELDSYLFSVVSLLHEATIPGKGSNESERMQLAELSLKASKRAKDQSAFQSAGKYAAIGVEALPANKWSMHYELTLDLYSTAAQVACSLGNIDELETLYQEVVSQYDRPLLDKLRVYHAMISYMSGALGKHNDLNAIDMIVDILARLGLSFPKGKTARFLSTTSGFRKAKRRMSFLQPQDISSLPMMKDRVHLEMMSLLDQLFSATYMCASDLMPLTIFARIRLTLEHGLCEYSVTSFACLALLFRDDPALASKAGRFSRLIMTILDCKNISAKAEVWLNAFIFCWTDPITSLMPRLLKGYETGLSVGDNENALWCIAQYIVIWFQSGKPLGTVEADCKIYLKQMIEFEREVVHADISIFFETIGNLMGRYDGDPTVMKSEQRFLSHSDHTVLGVFYTCQSILCLYFGDYDKGGELAVRIGNFYSKGVPGHVWCTIETFTRGMLLYAMAQKTRKRQYRKEAKRVHKTITLWARKGNPNIQHYDLLLNAEAAVLRGKLDAAERWYKIAIVTATRQGSIHERALASERYGEFLLNERKDPQEATKRFDDAIRCYSEWGASRKAQLLRDKHKGVFRKPIEIDVPLQGAG